MLRIYQDCLEMVREVRPYVERIKQFDPNLAGQIMRASTSVPLNVAEGSGGRGGRRRNSYDVALSEARETFCGLEIAVAAGYIRGIDEGLRARFDRIIGTLVRNVH